VAVRQMAYMKAAELCMRKQRGGERLYQLASTVLAGVSKMPTMSRCCSWPCCSWLPTRRAFSVGCRCTNCYWGEPGPAAARGVCGWRGVLGLRSEHVKTMVSATRVCAHSGCSVPIGHCSYRCKAHPIGGHSHQPSPKHHSLPTTAVQTMPCPFEGGPIIVPGELLGTFTVMIMPGLRRCRQPAQSHRHTY
jgi:hypothetical protein